MTGTSAVVITLGLRRSFSFLIESSFSGGHLRSSGQNGGGSSRGGQDHQPCGHQFGALINGAQSEHRYPVRDRSMAFCHCASVKPTGRDKVPRTILSQASHMISLVCGGGIADQRLLHHLFENLVLGEILQAVIYNLHRLVMPSHIDE